MNHSGGPIQTTRLRGRFVIGTQEPKNFCSATLRSFQGHWPKMIKGHFEKHHFLTGIWRRRQYGTSFEAFFGLFWLKTLVFGFFYPRFCVKRTQLWLWVAA